MENSPKAAGAKVTRAKTCTARTDAAFASVGSNDLTIGPFCAQPSVL